MNTGSRNPLLQQVALAIFNISITHLVRIEPEWIPMETNQQADFISRMMIGAYIQHCLKSWTRSGAHTLSTALLVTYANTQLPRFNSRFWNPGSEGVDTFTCDWGEKTTGGAHQCT